MKSLQTLAACFVSVAAFAADPPAAAPPAKAPGVADVLTSSKLADWRALDPENTLYLDLASGRVVIELAPAFAPGHVANIKALVRARYFDGLAIVRAQDNYVVQWGDADNKRADPDAKKTLPAEYTRPSTGLPFAALADPDAYAPEAGFSGDFPAARDPKGKQSWLVHCYGMVGVGRDLPPDTGSGAELYAVIGQAPRHLDRNLAVVGRIVKGIELLSVLPRGTGALGFYENPEQNVPIKSIRIAADVPASQRTGLEVLRTDTATFQAWVEARRNRREPFFVEPAGRIDVCNLPLPVRPHSSAP